MLITYQISIYKEVTPSPCSSEDDSLHAILWTGRHIAYELYFSIISTFIQLTQCRYDRGLLRKGKNKRCRLDILEVKGRVCTWKVKVHHVYWHVEATHL